MVANKNLLRWVGASFVLVNLVMLIVWGWGTLFLLGLGFGGVVCAAGWWADEIDFTNEFHLLVSLIAVLTVFGRYFYFVFTNPDDLIGGLSRFVSAIIFMIAIEVVAHSLVAAQNAAADADERDKRIERAASRWGYIVLVAGVWVLIGQLVSRVVFEQAMLSSYLLANLLFLIFVIAELANIVARLLYYRLGLRRG